MQGFTGVFCNCFVNFLSTFNNNLLKFMFRYIECRQNCAYNFPAMAKFCSSSPELLEKIYPVLCNFSTDPYYMVRKTVGAGLHEVRNIFLIQGAEKRNFVKTHYYVFDVYYCLCRLLEFWVKITE